MTECPYCGTRLRRRAPKLPRVNAPVKPVRRKGVGRFARGSGTVSSRARTRPRPARTSSGRWTADRPYATIAIVFVACAVWVVANAELELFGHMVIVGHVRGDWWRLLTAQFAYSEDGGGGVYAFVALLATGLFGWLLERRHGAAVVLTLYLVAGVTGALAADAVYTLPIVVGGNAGALALLLAWAVPDLEALRSGGYREGDLLGAGAFAVLLLAIPYARPEVSWLAGVVGAIFGLVVGLGLARFAQAEA